MRSDCCLPAEWSVSPVTPPADHSPQPNPSLNDRAREMIDVLLSVPEERREQAARLMCDGDADLLAIVTTAL